MKKKSRKAPLTQCFTYNKSYNFIYHSNNNYDYRSHIVSTKIRAGGKALTMEES